MDAREALLDLVGRLWESSPAAERRVLAGKICRLLLGETPAGRPEQGEECACEPDQANAGWVDAGGGYRTGRRPAA